MNIDIVRAWKDASYRASLSAEEQAMIPANPAGEVELSDAELAAIHGAHDHGHGHGGNNTATLALICLQTVILAVCVSQGVDCN